ncbi:MAG: DUF1549 domain-containing protein [Planctomycetales bacterium]
MIRNSFGSLQDMPRCVVAILLLTLSSSVTTAEETISLFDGKTLNGWVTLDDKPVTKGWEVVDGAIHIRVEKERAGYIKTTRAFENFDLEFEWRVAEAGNSGVKYLAKASRSDRGAGFYGCEYQLLDDEKHKNGRTPTKTAGALYDLYAPDADQKQLKPLDKFNHGRIVVDNGHIEHWLNGRKIVDAVIGGKDWRARVAKSKVSSVKDFAIGPGAILLQEHLSEAWFRNIRIKPLPKKADRSVDFAHQVMPVLRKHCAECHVGASKKGGLKMNTRSDLLAGGESGAVVVPGDSGKSRMIELLESNDDAERMPPKGPRVSAGDIAILKKWIDEDLPWDAGIAFGQSAWEPPLKPRVITLPPARNGRNHPIDRLLDADLAQRGQAPPPPLSAAACLRRATLDSIGLPPTPDVLDAFVADRADDKREKRIKQLLADDVAYADHWLTMWNDLLRNDYTGTGFITGGRKQITGWLYAALRENKPYDEFARELISPTAESAGFIDGIRWRGDVNASQTREIQFAQNVSQVFLGINMKCASCHDSFIDRWTLSEAYNLAAIYADKPLELNRCDKPTGKMAKPKWIFPELGDVDPNASKTERLKQLAELMTHPDNGRFTRTLVNRIWERLMGRGVVHPVDAMHTQPWNEDLLDYLAARFAEDGYDLRKFIRFVMTSRAYQSRAVILKEEPGGDYVYAGPIAKRMTAEQLLDSIWRITGTNPAAPEARVDRFSKSESTDSNSPLDRLKVAPIAAKWIWRDGEVGKKLQLRKKFNLSAAPVAAKLTSTCDNAFVMKINGERVAASREWQKPVYVDVTRYLQVGENMVEVDAEMFGGAAGFICPIDFRDGAGQRVIATDKTWEARPPGDKAWAAAAEINSHGKGPWGAILNPKATVGLPNRAAPPVRAALVKNDFLMRSLGRPHRDQVVTSRPSELTTLQAIDLSNGEILADCLRRGAKRLADQGKSGEELAAWIFRYALAREPSVGERAVLAKVVGDGRDPVAVEDLLWMVFMQPEFQMIR